YDDLIRGKIVTINFMYVECEGTCPGTTSTLVEVRNRLGDRVGQDIAMLSITLQPEADTPERLRDYAARYGAGPGMTFLTGKQTDIDVLRRALGLSVAQRGRSDLRAAEVDRRARRRAETSAGESRRAAAGGVARGGRSRGVR